MASSPMAAAGRERLYLRHGWVLEAAAGGGGGAAARVLAAEPSDGEVVGIVAGAVAAVAVLAGLAVGFLVWKRRASNRVVVLAKDEAPETGLRQAGDAPVEDAKITEPAPVRAKAMTRVLRFMGQGSEGSDDDEEQIRNQPKIRAQDSVHVTKRRLSQQEEKIEAEVNSLPKIRAKDSIHVTKKRASVREEKEQQEIEQLGAGSKIRAQDSVHVTKKRNSRLSFEGLPGAEAEAEAQPKGGRQVKDSIWVAKARSDRKEAPSAEGAEKKRLVKDSILVQQHRTRLKNRKVKVMDDIEDEAEDEDEESEPEVTEEELFQIAATRIQAVRRRLDAKKVVEQRKAAVEKAQGS